MNGHVHDIEKPGRASSPAPSASPSHPASYMEVPLPCLHCNAAGSRQPCGFRSLPLTGICSSVHKMWRLPWPYDLHTIMHGPAGSCFLVQRPCLLCFAPGLYIMLGCMQVLEMLERGETPPGIRSDIVDTPPDPLQSASEARLKPRAKPWERSQQGPQSRMCPIPVLCSPMTAYHVLRICDMDWPR